MAGKLLQLGKKPTFLLPKSQLPQQVKTKEVMVCTNNTFAFNVMLAPILLNAHPKPSAAMQWYLIHENLSCGSKRNAFFVTLLLCLFFFFQSNVCLRMEITISFKLKTTHKQTHYNKM